MAADSKREVMGIFALGIILPAALCTFGVGKSISHLRMKVYLFVIRYTT